MNIRQAREVLQERAREVLKRDMDKPGGYRVDLLPYHPHEDDLPSVPVTLLSDGTWEFV